MYCTVGELISYGGIVNASEADKVQLGGFIADAQAIIEAKVGVIFEAPTDSTRYFDAVRDVSGNVLRLGTDLAQVTTVLNGDGTTLLPAAYYAYPYNAPPYYALHLWPSSGIGWTYTGDPYAAIAITGRWAYSVTAPREVKRACVRLAHWLYKQKDTGNSDADRVILTSDGGVIMPAGFPRDVFTALTPKRRYLEVASAILAIYDALAAVTVSDGVEAITARNVGDQPNSLNTADAPLRILTVIDPMAGAIRSSSDTAWGAGMGSTLMQITWNIFDVLYHTPSFQGRGVRDVNIPLLTYQANYFEMLKTITFAGAQVLRVPVTMQPAILEYPLRSGHFWYAVRVMLNIQEGPC